MLLAECFRKSILVSQEHLEVSVVAFWRKGDGLRKGRGGRVWLAGQLCGAAGRSGGLPWGLAGGRVVAGGCVGAAGLRRFARSSG